MNDVKQRAIDTMDELHQTIEYCQYSTVMDGLLDIEPLQERDEALEELWAQFSDVPMNPETERSWRDRPPGSCRPGRLSEQ